LILACLGQASFFENYTQTTGQIIDSLSSIGPGGRDGLTL